MDVPASALLALTLLKGSSVDTGFGEASKANTDLGSPTCFSSPHRRIYTAILAMLVAGMSTYAALNLGLLCSFTQRHLSEAQFPPWFPFASGVY